MKILFKWHGNISQKEEKECIWVKHLSYAVLPRFKFCRNFHTFFAKILFTDFQSSQFFFFQVFIFYVQTQTSPRRCISDSGLNQLCAKKLGTKDLSVYICHRKSFCQYDFYQHAIWKLIHKLTLPPFICYQ